MTNAKQVSGRPLRDYGAATVLAAAVLVASAWGYQVLSQRYRGLSSLRVMPEIPFKYFPRFIGGWEGRDQPISDTVLKVAANDDYVCRTYYNEEKQLSAGLYVAYTCQPRRMIGHRPEICYAGSGWTREETLKRELVLPDHHAIEVLVHRFSKQGLSEQRIFVLNYYVVNGETTTDHSFFSGLKWRRPRAHNGYADYVAQVQISSETPEAAYALAQALSSQILFHLPRNNQSG